MTRQDLVKQLIGVLNNPDMDRGIQELNLVLTPIHLHQLNKDQKNKVTRLHDFMYKYYDGEVDKTVVMYQLILSAIRSLKSGLSAQYELYFWLNKILTTDPQNYNLLLYLTRAALQAKMAWPVEANHSWTDNGTGSRLNYLDVEDHLTAMYSWFLQDLGYDVDDPADFALLTRMAGAVLSYLNI